MAIKPIIQALLLADNVYSDADTGKRIIAGVFDSIALGEIPGLFPRPTSLYVSLTEIRGQLEVMTRYVDLDSNEVLMEHGPTVVDDPDDPLASVDFTVPVLHLPVPHEGVFAMEVHVGEELIGMLRITATLKEAEAEEEDENG